MPNIKSAKKRVKQSEKRRLRNKAVKSKVRTAVKKLDDALLSNNTENLNELYSKATSTLDKAAIKGVIHKNKAARTKSRLAMRIKKTQAEA